jgi:putative modified peptide
MHSAAQACEDLLARLFTDAEFRSQFQRDPQAVGRELGLDAAELVALTRIDWTGLELAASSYTHKRDARARGKRRWWWFG